MNTHANRLNEIKNQSVANSVFQKQSSSKSTFQFVDNRLGTITQRKLQEMANNSQQAQQVAQLQAMTDAYMHMTLGKVPTGMCITETM